MGDPTPADSGIEKPAQRFFTNVLWNWTGVAVQMFAGLIVSPYIIRKLGSEQYGIWALVFSMMGYYSLMDLGFRSAVVRFTAHYRARGENHKVNEVINTAFFYFSIISVVLFGVTLALWKRAGGFFRISEDLRPEFSWLVLVVGISLSVGMNLSVFSGAVEGFQRFDVSNRIRVVVFGLRAVGWFVLLAAGYGLVQMGVWTLLANLAFFSAYFVWFRHIFPELRFSRQLVTMSMFKQTAGYGAHTLLATLATRSLDQTPSLLIAYFRSAAEVGFYNFPLRLLQYAAEAVSNVGIVAAPQSAALAARGQLDTVANLGIYANRYCLSLYMPLAIFLPIYGGELFALWLKPDFAAESAPLLPVLAVGFALTQAAQFCSSSILFGLAKQQLYAYALLAEATASAAILVLTIPQHGILGAAVVGSVLMVLVRGLFTPWLLCHHLRFPFDVYMRSILVRPLATGLPVLGLLYLAKQSGLVPGRTWGEVAAAGIAAGLIFLSAAWFTCLEIRHRQLLKEWAADRWKRLSASLR